MITLTFNNLSLDEADALLDAAAMIGFEDEPEPEAVEFGKDGFIKPKRKRRTKAEMAEARAAEQEKEHAEETDRGATPDEAEGDPAAGPPRGRRGRRRRAVAGGDASTSSAEGTEAVNPTGRRRKQAKSSAEAADGAKEKKGRRASTKPAESVSSPSDGDEDLTDADMAKAASEAARVLTPKVVMDILQEFGVGVVNDIPQGERQEFVELLKGEVDRA